MKKRIFNLLLAVTLIGGATSSFVSCTDDSADVKTELQGQLSSRYAEALQSIADAKADLQKQINDLNSQINACGSNCGDKITDLTTRVQKLESKVAELDDIKNRLTTLEQFNIDNWFDGKKDEVLTALMSKVEDFLDKNDYVTSDDVNGLIGDYISDNLDGVFSKEQITQLIEEYVDNGGFLTKDDLEGLLNQEQVSQLISDFVKNGGYLTQDDIAGFLTEEQIKKLVGDYVDNSDLVTKDDLNVYLTEEQVNNLINNYVSNGGYLTQDDIAGFLTEEQVNTLISNYVSNGGYLTQDDIAGFLNEEQIKSLITAQINNAGFLTQEDIADFLTEEQVNTMLASYLKADSLKAKVQDIVEEYGYLKSVDLADALAELGVITQDDLDAFLSNEVTNKIEDILSTKDYVTQESLDTQLTELAETIAEEVDAKVAALESKTRTLLRDLITSMITSIEINATENPIFGSASLPVGLRTTVLGAFYGQTAATVSFPDYDLLDKAGVNINPMGWDAGATLFEEAEGNAGTLYLTINPNTVDFEEQFVSLVTSQGNESPIRLSAVKGSDKELSFGFARATNANGFYETAATLSSDDIEKVKVNIDLEKMKAAAQNALQQRTTGSVAKLAATLFTETANALNMPAYAVKASWKDYIDTEASTNDNNELVETPVATEHSVMSQYAIAATAVKPLSYDFMKDAHFNIPGIESIENTIGNAIDKVFDQMKGLIPDLSDLGNIKLDSIKLRNSTRDSLKIKITIKISAGDLNAKVDDLYKQIDIVDDNGKVIGHADITDVVFRNEEYEITYILDLSTKFDAMIEDMNSSLNFEDLNKALQRLSEFADLSANLDELKDWLKNGIFSYIDRINNTFNSLVGSINTALQPCLLFTDANGNISRVTTSKLGTQVSGTSIVLAPTSYTAELFAPAFKKFIAVTDITGNTTKTPAEMNAVNADFGKILSGNTCKTVTLEGLEKGCTYEITYSAIDYSGNTRTKAFYIAVK